MAFLAMRKIFQRQVHRMRLPVTLSSLVSIGASFEPASAHPVVFTGGTALMGHHHGDMAEFEVIHSPSWWLGLGVNAERTPSSTKLMAKSNVLVWRGNYPDLQSNLYLGLAGGQMWSTYRDGMTSHSTPQSKRTHSLFHWSAEWDAEDREFYARTRYLQKFHSTGVRGEQTLLRLGLAPYKAAADELTWWGMLEWTTDRNNGDHTVTHEVTPLVRLFYKNALVEVGMSVSGRASFNYMFHYF
jgi:hypothetical protein